MNKIKLFLLIVLFSNLLVKADVYVRVSGLPGERPPLYVEGDAFYGKSKALFLVPIQDILRGTGVKFEMNKIIKLSNKLGNRPILITAFARTAHNIVEDIQEDYIYNFSYSKADGLKFISKEPYKENEEKKDVGAAAK